MTIEELQKLQAEMPTTELLEKAADWNSKLCKSGGRAWSLRVPVDINDPDQIFSEVCRRLENSQSAIKEMERMLVVIQRIEEEMPATWLEATAGTGIATANAYRLSIKKARGIK